MKSRPPFLFKLAALTLSSLLSFAAIAQTETALADYVVEQFGEAPPVPSGELSAGMQFAARVAFVDSTGLGAWDTNQSQAVAAIGKSGDPRLTWIISDMLRFIPNEEATVALTGAASALLGKTFDGENAWNDITNHLLAWDIPAPPGYFSYKELIYTLNIPGWEALFVEGDIDWRLVSWGGVVIDDRPYDTTDDPCRCIPAVDNPSVTNADDANWLEDDDIVFGLVINGDARAYPRQIMEVREMVNDTLGGRDLGIPYCSLCAAAQAFFTDQLPDGIDRPILRTSGLLSRSNKVMFDLNTNSLFDTFTGRAVTGTLADENLTLQQTTVITTDWGTWKRDYPNTTVLQERYSLGRNPDFRNGRDADGPIFPIGESDPRLPVHEDVIGAITSSGQAVAFPRGAAFLSLSRGEDITLYNVRLELDAGGIKAINNDDGSELGSHQAFWFAWSQFYPDTELWQP